MADNQDIAIQRASRAAQEATMAAYESYLHILQRMTRSARIMEAAAQDTQSILNDQIKLLSDSGVVRNITAMMKKSENIKVKMSGQLLESGAQVIDTITKIQQSMIVAKTTAIQLGASFVQTSDEVARFSGVMLANMGDLKASLHVQQQETDKYFNTVKHMAGSYAMMNAQIIDQSGATAESIHTTLFKFSNAFQYDIVPLTKMVYGAAGRMGGDADPKVAIYRMMDSWVDATKMLRAVGMSTTKGLGDLASIVAGTEGSVLDGTKRIANIASLYTSVFSILQRKGQEALADRFTQIMDSGLRQLSPQASGLMALGKFTGGLTGNMTDPLAGGMVIRAAFRMGEDLRTGKALSTNDMMKMVVSSIEGYAKTPIFAFTPTSTKGLSSSRQEEMGKQYLLLDRVMKEFFPEAGDFSQRMTLMGVLQNWKDNKNISDEDAKKIKKAFGSGLDNAAEIEGMKRTSLQQIWDYVSGIYMKAVGMMGIDVAGNKRKAKAILALQSGSEKNYIESHMAAYKRANAQADTTSASLALARQWQEFQRDSVLSATDPAHGDENIVSRIRELSTKYSLRPKLSPADASTLDDATVPAETKMNIYARYLNPLVKQDLYAKGITDEDTVSDAQSYLNPWGEEAMSNRAAANIQGGASAMAGSITTSAAYKVLSRGSSTTLSDVKKGVYPSRDIEGVTEHKQGDRGTFQEGELTVGASDALRLKNMGGLAYILSKAKILSEANLTGDTLEHLKTEIAGEESAGRGYSAINSDPASSATGKYQFVRDTAAQLYRQHSKFFGALGVGAQAFESKENMRQVMLGPQGALIQEKMMEFAVKDYAKTLRALDVPITAETLKLVHFMGLGGFKKWVREGASLGYVPGADKGFKNKTVGEYLGLATRSGAWPTSFSTSVNSDMSAVLSSDREIRIDKTISAVDQSGVSTGNTFHLTATFKF